MTRKFQRRSGCNDLVLRLERETSISKGPGSRRRASSSPANRGSASCTSSLPVPQRFLASFTFSLGQFLHLALALRTMRSAFVVPLLRATRFHFCVSSYFCRHKNGSPLLNRCVSAAVALAVKAGLAGGVLRTTIQTHIGARLWWPISTQTIV
jgi:hypothetical protein